MPPNLYKPQWGDLDQGELRYILLERIGKPGQYDGASAEVNPVAFYLPLAREQCQVKLLFENGKRLVGIEPGAAFDPTRWALAEKDIEQRGNPIIGRDIAFSGYRVQGSWRGERSHLQILPAPDSAPVAPVEMAQHPFVLECPIIDSDEYTIRNFRRRQMHREMTLLLNVLLSGGATWHTSRPRQLWATVPGERDANVKWVQEFYFADINMIWQDNLSAPASVALEQIDADKYYASRGNDGRGLRVPSDLDDSICRYLELRKTRSLREKFGYAAFWMHQASQQWTQSASASYASLVIACEALGKRNLKPSARFASFLEEYAAEESTALRRVAMYDMRNDFLHGTGLIELDQEADYGWEPPGNSQKELLSELWTLTRSAMRNWIKNPSVD